MPRQNNNQKQSKDLIDIVNQNPFVKKILGTKLFPENITWYLGAGCIYQSVWNYLSGQEITDGIKDYDLIYYDPDSSYESEDVYIKKGQELFKNIPITIEIRNQTRIPLWFKSKYNEIIKPYTSCEDAISRWPTTASAIGINQINGQINICAPFGLDDLFNMIVRPNKQTILFSVYEKKIENWVTRWPKLKVIPWKEI